MQQHLLGERGLSELHYLTAAQEESVHPVLFPRARICGCAFLPVDNEHQCPNVELTTVTVPSGSEEKQKHCGTI